MADATDSDPPAAEPAPAAAAESAEDEAKVTLISLEGDRFVIAERMATKSTMIKTMLEDGEDDDEAVEIPLPGVSTDALAKVTEFLGILEKEKELPDVLKPLVSTDMKELVSQRFGGFMDALTRDQVIALTTSKTISGVRSYFGIINDLSPEEEAEIRADSRWPDAELAEVEAARAKAGGEEEGKDGGDAEAKEDSKAEEATA